MVALQRLEPVAVRRGPDRHALALKGAFGILGRWDIDNETARVLLGSPPERTFFEWKRGRAGRLSEDTLRRIVSAVSRPRCRRVSGEAVRGGAAAGVGQTSQAAALRPGMVG